MIFLKKMKITRLQREPQRKNHAFKRGFCMAPRPGFEPGYTAPEAVVLPLDDLGMWAQFTKRLPNRQRTTIFRPFTKDSNIQNILSQSRGCLN